MLRHRERRLERDGHASGGSDGERNRDTGGEMRGEGRGLHEVETRGLVARG